MPDAAVAGTATAVTLAGAACNLAAAASHEQEHHDDDAHALPAHDEDDEAVLRSEAEALTRGSPLPAVRAAAEALLARAVRDSEGWVLERVEGLAAQLARGVAEHAMHADRGAVVEALGRVLTRAAGVGRGGATAVAHVSC